MEVHGWSCVLGLLCMSAEVTLATWTVSQRPLSISVMRINSSAEIRCSTSLSDPMGLYLRRSFDDSKDVVYLSLEKGRVTRNTPGDGFTDRIHVAPDQQVREGCGFTMQLSLLGPEDTDLYYCSWTYFESDTASRQQLDSDGTVIIVRETDPQDQCRDQVLDLVLVAVSVTAFTVVVFLFIGVLIVRRKRFQKKFRPAGVVKAGRPNRPRHVCPQQGAQHYPYLITSSAPLDFRGIL